MVLAAAEKVHPVVLGVALVEINQITAVEV
jgi:hypothetical protein